MFAVRDRLHYDVHEGSGEPMLLVHGIMGGRGLWSANIEALRKMCSPIVVELYGHGRSPAPDELDRYRADAYVEEFERIRTELGVDRWWLTGQSLGAKAFYRVQIPALWAAVSLNVAATSGGTLVESLQPQSASLTGTPVGSGRAGLELNLPGVEVKLGASAFYGPRNDQHDPDVLQRGFGADARLIVRWLSLAAEWVKIDQFAGAADKDNGLGRQTLVSGFHADGAYVTASLSLPLGLGPLKKLTPYGRYARRHAQFEGFVPITVDAITAGARLDLWDSLAVKAEGLFNREVEGAPNVPNDVFTSSLVFSW